MRSIKFHIEGNKVLFDDVVVMKNGDTMSFINERFDEYGNLLVDEVVIIEALEKSAHPTATGVESAGKNSESGGG